ncbi:hypothetical protein CIW82_18385 (plasmid) [Acetobacter tropicalis]|uniref:Uncharacterized protein n=1 Tax=Acetobacter tropicalis TaxID=104102 RepID=A0A291PN32_9PROT|nr:hypothetical protein CIW82_18385 [Acetobacter tropicalis]
MLAIMPVIVGLVKTTLLWEAAVTMRGTTKVAVAVAVNLTMGERRKRKCSYLSQLKMNHQTAPWRCHHLLQMRIF